MDIVSTDEQHGCLRAWPQDGPLMSKATSSGL